MTSPSNIETSLERLLDAPPVVAPRSQVKHDDDRMVITIAGRPKVRLPSGLVTVSIAFAASAFICPGVFIVAIVALPILLLVLGGIYLRSPEILKQPVDTQKVVFSPEKIWFYESCPRSFDPEVLQEEDATTVLSLRDALASARLLLSGDTEDDRRGIEISTDDGVSLLFGSSLFPKGEEGEDDEGLREIEWLWAVVDNYLGGLEGGDNK